MKFVPVVLIPALFGYCWARVFCRRLTFNEEDDPSLALTLSLELVMRIKKRKRYDPTRIARTDLAFPEITAKSLGKADLVGYYSYLNWLLPPFQLGRSLRLSLLLFGKVIAETDFDAFRNVA